MSNNRIQYFDALKGFAIILVVFCHYVLLDGESILGNMVMSLAWAAVPCFFMVTGGLLHKAKVFSWQKWIGRLLKIYGCMVVWKFLYWIFFACISDLSVDSGTIIKYLFFMGNAQGIEAGHVWFIVAYLQVLLFFPITYQLYTRCNMGYFVFLMVYTWLFSIFKSAANFIGLDLEPMISLIPVVDDSTNMLFYCLLGVLLLHYRKEITEFLNASIFRKCIPVILIMIGGIGAMLIKYSYAGTFRWAGIYLPDGYNRISTMLMAVGIYLVFSQELLWDKCTTWLAKLGKHTMGIFYLHYPLLVLSRKIITKFIDNFYDYCSFELNVLQTMTIIAICCGITIVAKKIPLVKNLFV